MKPTWVAAALLLLVVITPIVYAATTATTLFTFRVPTARSITVTYGGSCSASAFFFNELDANFDPDTDGNAAKVKPNAFRKNLSDATSSTRTFVGITGPSSGDAAYTGVTTSNPPTDPNSPTLELTSGEYDLIEADDTQYLESSTTSNNRYPAVRFIFKTGTVHPQNILDLNFLYLGDAVQDVTDCSGGSGTEHDINLYVYNFSTSSYTDLNMYDGSGAQASVNPNQLTKFLDQNIYQYVAPDGNIQFLVRTELFTGTNNESCLFSDYAQLILRFIPPTTTFCQSSTLAPMTFTNNGNTAVNIDGNFASQFTGVDTNLVLKVWMGTGSGCGSDGNGLGGWEKDCSITGTTTPVTQTQCKNYNEYNETTGSRLVSTLAVGDTNQLCFSGDFNTVQLGGDHNQNFQAGVLFS